MKNIMKGKIGTIIILLFTLVLAGVAIFTAVRLYQLRNQAVAPNVPSSIPHASELCGGVVCESSQSCVTLHGIQTCVTSGQQSTSSSGSCSLNFSLVASSPTPSPTPSVFPTCDSKKAYIAANSNSAITDKTVDFSLGSQVQNDGNVAPGQELIYVITIKEIQSNKTYTTSDTIDSKLDFVNYESTDNCSFNSSTKVLSCPGTDTGRTNVQVKIKVKVKSASTSGIISNTANVTTASQTTPSACSITLNISTQTSTPTPTATPTGTPNPSATPNACNGTCGSNFNCQSNYVCYQGFCRNPSCTTSTSCGCGGTSTPAPTGTPRPTLPQSGTDWPTVAGFGVGLFVILGSLLLAL